MEIRFLSEVPTLCPLLAKWHHREWGDLTPEWTAEEVLQDLRSHTGTHTIPTTLVALEEGEPLGSASLLPENFAELDAWSPWLASVYVARPYRRRGVGRALVARICEIAVGMGVERIYLFTVDRASFYLELGWTIEETTTIRDTPVVIMSRVLSVAPDPDPHHDGTGGVRADREPSDPTR